MTGNRGKKCLLILAGLGALAILPYLPGLALPFISDDYLQVHLAREYGPVSGWSALAGDALYRARATSLVFTYWTERAFGFSPFPFNLSSLFLHLLNTWLFYLLSRKLGLAPPASFFAAGFFAVHEGHQEAVLWYAAVHDLLVFLFVAATLLAWLRYCTTLRRRDYALAFGCYVLALLSKESAVAVAPVLVLLAPQPRRAWRAALPFAAAAVVYFGLAWAGRGSHQHFNDGTFSLLAPFWITLRNGIGRLLWIWGVLALAALCFWRSEGAGRTLRIAAVWMVVFLLPYSFLTYMPRIPSRHTYLASAGLAWIVACAMMALWSRLKTVRWPVYVAGALIVLHNCGWIWIRKQAQYRERAEPTEALVELARGSDPIRVECFPYGEGIARLAVEMRVGQSAAPILWNAKHPVFTRACLSVERDLKILGSTRPPGDSSP
ncbi:MAG: glycosyltransferase family 39 protein [Acidobacteria bacterium]|nr:glycosyltransferase family 39 protein [Acidobacteriota bacterium]